MNPCTPATVEQLREVRRQRAQALCDALDQEAGPDRVLAGWAKVFIFCKANEVDERYCSGEPT